MIARVDLVVSESGCGGAIGTSVGNEPNLDRFVIKDRFDNTVSLDAIVAFSGLLALAKKRGIGIADYCKGFEELFNEEERKAE